MPADPPVNFEPLAASGGGAPYTGYPHRLKASDMMKNWVFATLDVDADLVEEQSGLGGHTQRRLKIQPGTTQNQLMRWDGTEWAPLTAPSGNGPFVLAMVGGNLVWLDTEECN